MTGVLLLLSGCSVKNYTPEIPLTFTQNVEVTSGDFSYTCEICKTEELVSVTVTSTYAKGMIMSYDGNEISFRYSDYAYSLDGSNFEKRNAAIVVYEVFDYINSSQSLDAKKIDGGYRYDGKISLGDFTLIQNDDNSLSSLIIRDADYKIDFQSE